MKVENKKFAFFPILNSSIEDRDPELDSMTSVLFVILEDLHTLRKNLRNSENTFQKTSTPIRESKIHSAQMWPILMQNYLLVFRNS